MRLELPSNYQEGHVELSFKHYPPKLVANGIFTHGETHATVRWFCQGEAFATTEGDAFLHPKDNYCRETGRKLALKRALHGLGKEDRTAVWTAFHHYRGKYGH